MYSVLRYCAHASTLYWRARNTATLTSIQHAVRGPKGPRGVKKSDFFLQIKLLSSCSKIDPKRQKLQKSVKIEKKKSQKTLFFLYLFKYSAIWGQS